MFFEMWQTLNADLSSLEFDDKPSRKFWDAVESHTAGMLNSVFEPDS